MRELYIPSTNPMRLSLCRTFDPLGPRAAIKWTPLAVPHSSLPKILFIRIWYLGAVISRICMSTRIWRNQPYQRPPICLYRNCQRRLVHHCLRRKQQLQSQRSMELPATITLVPRSHRDPKIITPRSPLVKSELVPVC